MRREFTFQCPICTIQIYSNNRVNTDFVLSDYNFGSVQKNTDTPAIFLDVQVPEFTACYDSFTDTSVSL